MPKASKRKKRPSPPAAPAPPPAPDRAEAPAEAPAAPARRALWDFGPVPKHAPLDGREWRCLLFAALVPILFVLPYMDKAYHVDDPLFVWTAQRVLETPGDFYGFTVNWYTEDVRMYEIMQNPPLLSYYLALFGWFFGWGEVVMHLAMFLPHAAAGAGAYVIARRFCSQPLFAAMLAMLTPAFAVSATQVMSDIAMLAFWLWALHLWLLALERDSAGYAALAALLIGLGALTKYFAASLIPLLVVYTLLRYPARFRLMLYFIIPVVMLSAYEMWTYRLYGVGLLGDAAEFATRHREEAETSLAWKFRTTLVFTGGCLASVAFLTPWLWRRKAALAGVGAAGALALFIMLFPERRPLPNRAYTLDAFFVPPLEIEFAPPHVLALLQWAVFLVLGVQILALAWFALQRERSPEALMFGLWIGGTLFFVFAINHFVNARVILPIAPAAAILAVRQLEHMRPDWFAAPPWKRLAPLAPAAALVLLLCFVDYRIANAARAGANDIMAMDHAGPVIFTGHSGFQYYMEAQGAVIVDQEAMAAQTPAGDESYALAVNNWSTATIPRAAFGDWEVIVHETPSFASTTHYYAHAGFYSDATGGLPFVFGRVPNEEFIVVRITRFDEDAPQPPADESMLLRERYGWQ